MQGFMFLSPMLDHNGFSKSRSGYILELLKNFLSFMVLTIIPTNKVGSKVGDSFDIAKKIV